MAALKAADVRARERAIARYLDEDPDQSVHQLAKKLNNEFGNPLMPGEIAIVKKEWQRQRTLATSIIPSVEPRQRRVCSRCGGGHWVSQCEEPEKVRVVAMLEQVHPPAVAQLIADAAEAEELFTGDELERAAAERAAVNEANTRENNVQNGIEEGTKAEVVVTAPHPEASKKTTAGMMLRRQYLNQLLDEDPGADPALLVGKIRERFGIGLHWEYVYDTCRVARELHQLPAIVRHGPRGTVKNGVSGEPLPKFEQQPEEEEYADNPDDECLWLAKQASDVMRAHGLTELRLVVENGKAKWVYTVVRKAEGEVTL